MSNWVPYVPVLVSLRRLFPSASFVGCADIQTSLATDNSSDCRPQMLFAVIRGQQADGLDYVDEAVQRGAMALLVDRPLAHVSLPQCVVPDVRRAYAELCSAMMAHPSRRLGLAAVTGTNGKTTIAWLIRSILQAAGHQTGLLGTIEYHDGVRSEPSTLTTPASHQLSSRLAGMLNAGTTHAAIELSSHALDQRRSAGTLLDVAILSNITQDHFDYHQTFEHYRRSKLRIFDYLKPAGLAVINLDDAGSRSCLDDATKRIMTYGLDQPADVTAYILKETPLGTDFRLMLGVDSAVVHTRLVGRHNVSNCLAAATAANHLGVSLTDICRGIEALSVVPGRLERIEAGQPFQVYVDYAHTEQALRAAVQALKQVTPGRVICVFGAGGDRDRTKRPQLAKAAAAADLAVVTTDNPRSEDPELIIRDILTGFVDVAPHVEVRRELAIGWALQQARPGDSVLIAGKGHETEQTTGDQCAHFDDREVARQYLWRNCRCGSVHSGDKTALPVVATN
jgi:UDP-N-acetylmuramoyl-L-alanyl-D-glutamate--2,6-diaminopimelate ligase